MVPGRLAPVTSTGVPTGSETESQPFVLVAAPVPEQCAACPMYTFVASKNTKLAVHCAPSVNVCTPGSIGALAAGAHAGSADALAAPAAQAARTAMRTGSRRRMADLPPANRLVTGATTPVGCPTC